MNVKRTFGTILTILGILNYLNVFNQWLISLVIIPFGIYWNRFKEVTSKVSKIIKFYNPLVLKIRLIFFIAVHCGKML